jgi:hypothetical protein
MADHWRSSLASVGIRKVKENEKFIACDFQDGSFADQYIGKWGIEHEMTKGHVKKGRETFTPFDLLRLSEKDDLIFEKQPSKLFQEFAIAFKGARQLFFSRGLKHAFAIKDISDDQIADSVLDEAEFLTHIEDMAFHLLCKYKKRAQFLDCITQDKINGVVGNGSAESLISSLAEYEILILEEINSIEVSIPKSFDELPPVLFDSFTLT